MVHRYLDSAFLTHIGASVEKTDKLTSQIHDYLKQNYPESVLKWVPTADWTAKTVHLSQIDMARRPGGRNDKKTDGIAQAIKDGKKMSPVVLVDTGDGKFKVADGYHRTLATQRAGKKSISAYVGKYRGDDFDLAAIHAAKLNVVPGEKAEIRAGGNPNISRLPSQGPFAPAAPTDVPDERYPTTAVTIHPSGKRIHVRVADTPTLRKTGLQNSPDPAGENWDGLLMKWPGTANATLHNKDVSFPVSAQWFSSDGMYRDGQLQYDHLGHVHMDAGDPTPQHAPGPHGHVLEVNRDAFDALGLGPGSSISMDDEKQAPKPGGLAF